jgi:ankyrin repeat protein
VFAFYQLFSLAVFLCSFFVSPIFAIAIEKERFVTFLKEYDASQNKFGGKVAYALEKNCPDFAQFLLLGGENYGLYQTTYPFTGFISGMDNRNLLNRHLNQPLITAIRNGYTEVAILMIQMGGGNVEEYKIEVVPQGGEMEVGRKNAMIAAIEANNYDVVASLLASGFDVNTKTALNPPLKKYIPSYQDRNVYKTPLFQAIELQRLDIAELLLKYGADVEMVSRHTGSPLLKAVEDNFIEGVLLLSRYGANSLRHDNSALSPMDYAIQKNYFDIVDILFDAATNEIK